MRYLSIILTFLLLYSCGSSNNVVSNRLIQKRKYTRGWHWNLKSPASKETSRANNKTQPVQAHINKRSSSVKNFIIEEPKSAQEAPKSRIRASLSPSYREDVSMEHKITNAPIIQPDRTFSAPQGTVIMVDQHENGVPNRDDNTTMTAITILLIIAAIILLVAGILLFTTLNDALLLLSLLLFGAAGIPFLILLGIQLYLLINYESSAFNLWGSISAFVVGFLGLIFGYLAFKYW